MKRKKKDPVRLIVELDAENKAPRTVVIDISKGYKLKIDEFADNVSIFNEEGNIVKSYRWEISYNVEFTFIYRED